MLNIYDVQYTEPTYPDFQVTKSLNEYKRSLSLQMSTLKTYFGVILAGFLITDIIVYVAMNMKWEVFPTDIVLFYIFSQTALWYVHYRKIKGFKKQLNLP